MPKVCIICNKGAMAGRQYARRGAAKGTGGAGIKVARKCPRRFLPNLQKIKIILKGVTQTALVCTRCIKSGRIVKA